MKEGFDKEIDSLLRRKARGAAKPFADGDGAAEASRAAAHLDADELGAFAEGALPAPARLAAASHLADCDGCRKMVVALSQSHGVAAETEKRDAAAAAVAPAPRGAEKPAGWWRAWAAWLFSPRGMRLAVPVLALSVVAVISYVALRSRDAGAPNTSRRPSGQLETVRQQSNANAPAAATGPGTNGAEGLVAQDSGAPAPGGAAVAPPPSQPSVGRGHGAAEAQPVTSGAAEDAAAPPPPAPASPATEGPAVAAKAAPRPAVVEETESQPRSEDREKSARAAEPVDEIAAGDLAAQQQRRAAQSRVGNEIQMPDGGARNQRRSGDNVTSNNVATNVYGGAGAAAPRESERDRRADEGAGPARRSRAAARAEKKADEADEAARAGETRTAAGRRFRREGGAWVDVNYRSSMSSTGVRRGTEAFRALVADHPEIGRVAEQLGGEVVVVVRGRAYRIR